MKAVTIQDGKGTSVPPNLKYVIIYFIQKGLSEKEAIVFYEYLNKRKWTTKTGVPIVNWKAFINEWIWNFTQQKRAFETSDLKRSVERIIQLKSGTGDDIFETAQVKQKLQFASKPVLFHITKPFKIGIPIKINFSGGNFYSKFIYWTI